MTQPSGAPIKTYSKVLKKKKSTRLRLLCVLPNGTLLSENRACLQTEAGQTARSALPFAEAQNQPWEQAQGGLLNTDVEEKVLLVRAVRDPSGSVGRLRNAPGPRAGGRAQGTGRRPWALTGQPGEGSPGDTKKEWLWVLPGMWPGPGHRRTS